MWIKKTEHFKFNKKKKIKEKFKRDLFVIYFLKKYSCYRI